MSENPYEGREETLASESELCRSIWNAAIEAALNEAHSDSEIYEAIRKLKK